MSVVNAQRTAQLVYPISMDVFINFIIRPKIFVLNLCLDFLPLKGKIRTPLIVHIVSLPTFSHRFQTIKVKMRISILQSND